MFRLIRVPARFNVFASLCVAPIAAAGLQDLLERLPRRSHRVLLVSGLAVVAVADLAMVPFGERVTVPVASAAYDLVRRTDPRAAILDAPMFESARSQDISSVCGYWQSIHRLRTSAGYTGFPNLQFDSLIVANSPFAAATMLGPGYLATPSATDLGAASEVDFRDYVWLFLTYHKYDYLFLHCFEPSAPALRAWCDGPRISSPRPRSSGI